jgi:hypothetical protein
MRSRSCLPSFSAALGATSQLGHYLDFECAFSRSHLRARGGPGPSVQPRTKTTVPGVPNIDAMHQDCSKPTYFHFSAD